MVALPLYVVSLVGIVASDKDVGGLRYIFVSAVDTDSTPACDRTLLQTLDFGLVLARESLRGVQHSPGSN